VVFNKTWALAAATLWAFAGAADAAERKKIVAPDWLEMPKPEDFAEHYPGVAASLEIEGAATIACGINAEGKLVGCEVASETPKGLGFGAAAVAISGDFKMKPQIENGVAVDGGEVRIPIRFVLPKAPGGPPTAPPAAASPGTFAEALRAVDALGMVDRSVNDNLKFRERGSTEGVPDPVRRAVEEAQRAAWTQRRSDLREAYALALASVFSEEELAGLADFAAGPGKSLSEDKVVGVELVRAMADLARAIREPARAAFCAKSLCPTATALAQVWRPVEERDGRIDNPQWSRSPSEYTVNRAAVAPAGVVGLSGAVRMTCRAAKDGKLADCAADEELPKGLGYGAAAVKLAEHYRLSPILLATGGAGRKVTVRVGFTPTTLPEAYAPPKPKSDAAVALARKLVAANDTVESTRRNIEIQILGFESKKAEGVDPATYALLIDAYRDGALKAAEQVAEHQAKVWAAYRSEEDLAVIAAFQASPAGKAMRERNGALDVASRKAYAYVAMKIVADARSMFCKTHECDGPPPVQPTVVKPEASTRKP
jgi:TonB family protein